MLHTDHRPTYLLAAKKKTQQLKTRTTQKSLSLEKKKFKDINCGKKAGDWAKSRKGKTKGATGLARITREQIERWNPMTALSFQTGRRLRTPETPRLPSDRFQTRQACGTVLFNATIFVFSFIQFQFLGLV